jgi:putative transposase
MMYLPNTVYHVYNQTNNTELLFIDEADYNRFKDKVRKHLLPVADILCYCLMPTHFHFQTLLKVEGLAESTVHLNQQRFHEEIRIMLSSYVRYFNNRHGRRGSLLRSKTKAKPAYSDFVPEDFELKDDQPFTLYIPYIKTCFRYIHHNPNEAELVSSPEDWPYSSAPDYAGLRDEGICNYELTERLLGIKRME